VFGSAPNNTAHAQKLKLEVAMHQVVEEMTMSLGMIILIVVVLMLIGAIPTWPHSQNWGYYPSGGLGLVVIVLLILLLMGRL